MKLSEFIDQDIAANFGQVRLPVYSAPLPAWPVYPGATQSPGVPPPPPARATQSPGVPPPPPRSVTEQRQAAAAVPAAAAVTSSAPAKTAITPGLRGEIVSRVQAKFNELGLGPLDVDGIYGPKSEAAARRFYQLIEVPFTGTIHADTVLAILSIPQGTPLTPKALLPLVLTPSELEARNQSTAPDASGFDLTVWVKGNWQWFLIGAIGLVTLGLFLTGPKDALAGVKEVESLDLDDLDLGNPLPPPRKRKARRSKRKARR